MFPELAQRCRLIHVCVCVYVCTLDYYDTFICIYIFIHRRSVYHALIILSSPKNDESV